MSQEIKIVSGGGFHLPGSDIDTDRIIPAQFLKCVTFEGLGEHVFEDDRKQLKGLHPFDDPSNKTRSVLVVDENFGCGSSREHAVPALTQQGATQGGIKAIIGLSFAAIFRGNALANGLVCVTVTKQEHEFIVRLLAEGVSNIRIDLESMMVRVGCGTESANMGCEMPESHRENLITGAWDDIATCLEAGSAIEETAARLSYI